MPVTKPVWYEVSTKQQLQSFFLKQEGKLLYTILNDSRMMHTIQEKIIQDKFYNVTSISMEMWHRNNTNTGCKEINHRADSLACPLYHLIAKACSIDVDWSPGHRINVKTKCDFQRWEMRNNSVEKPKENQSKQLPRHFMTVALCYIATSCSSFRFVEFTPPQQKHAQQRWHITLHFTMCKTMCKNKKPLWNS